MTTNIKLGRKKAYRQIMLRNLATSLVLYESIKTTETKAKLVRTKIDYLIKKASKVGIDSKRYIYGFFLDKNASKKLFSELVPRYKNRTSGLVNIVRLGSRLGDNASIVRLELTDKKKFAESSKPENKNKSSQSENKKNVDLKSDKNESK